MRLSDWLLGRREEIVESSRERAARTADGEALECALKILRAAWGEVWDERGCSSPAGFFVLHAENYIRSQMEDHFRYTIKGSPGE